jgi:hypothetical protein
MSFTAEGRLFVTLDLDFSDVRRYKPGTHPGIFLIRVRVAAVRLLLSLAFRRDQDSSAPEVRVLRASASGPPGSHRCGGTPKPVSAGWAANRHDRCRIGATLHSSRADDVDGRPGLHDGRRTLSAASMEARKLIRRCGCRDDQEDPICEPIGIELSLRAALEEIGAQLVHFGARGRRKSSWMVREHSAALVSSGFTTTSQRGRLLWARERSERNRCAPADPLPRRLLAARG